MDKRSADKDKQSNEIKMIDRKLRELIRLGNRDCEKLVYNLWQHIKNIQLLHVGHHAKHTMRNVQGLNRQNNHIRMRKGYTRGWYPNRGRYRKWNSYGYNNQSKNLRNYVKKWDEDIKDDQNKLTMDAEYDNYRLQYYQNEHAALSHVGAFEENAYPQTPFYNDSGISSPEEEKKRYDDYYSTINNRAEGDESRNYEQQVTDFDESIQLRQQHSFQPKVNGANRCQYVQYNQLRYKHYDPEQKRERREYQLRDFNQKQFY